MLNRSHLLLIPLLLFSSPAFAQGDRGAITGPIADESGAAIPNVVVEAVNTATSARYETISTGTGSYHLAGLPIGLYDVSAKANGFNTNVQSGVPKRAGMASD
jgi:hypothetical protein